MSVILTSCMAPERRASAARPVRPARLVRVLSLPLVALALVVAGAGCDDPDVVPPPPVELPPEKVSLPAQALPPPAEVPNPDPVGAIGRPTVPFDHRLLWHYARLMDPEVVTSFAGESDLLKDLPLMAADHPQRAAVLDLLFANWNATPRPQPHVRVALVRIFATLLPTDPRTTMVLLTALEDPTMKVRFRANHFLKDIYAMDVDYDPNVVEAAPRAAAIARWKREIQAVRAREKAATQAPPPLTTD